MSELDKKVLQDLTEKAMLDVVELMERDTQLISASHQRVMLYCDVILSVSTMIIAEVYRETKDEKLVEEILALAAARMVRTCKEVLTHAKKELG